MMDDKKVILALSVILLVALAQVVFALKFGFGIYGFGKYGIGEDDTPPPAPSSSGGGGGGGGFLGGPLGNITRYFTQTAGEKPIVVTIDDTRVDFRRIEISTKDTAAPVRLTFTKTEKPPAVLEENENLSAYQYAWLTTVNLNPNSVVSAKVVFRVSDSWLSAKGFVKDDVVLKHYADGEWKTLDTARTASAFSYHEYQAVAGSIPVSSIFAIAAEVKSVQEKAAEEKPAIQIPELPRDIIEQVASPPTFYVTVIFLQGAMLLLTMLILLIVVYRLNYHKVGRRHAKKKGHDASFAR